MNGDLSSRIRAIRLSLGMRQADFATAVGVNQATVSRWESGSTPEFEFLVKIAEVADVPLSDLTNSDVEVGPISPRHFIKGEVAAGVWRDAWEWERSEWMEYQGGAHITASPDARFGLVVAGESMNEVYPPGTILDCVSLIHGGIAEVKSGQRVVVVRKKYHGEVEATVKEYLKREDGEWLVPRSNNPAFQVPIKVHDDNDPEIEETVIVAVVRGSYKPE